MQIVGGGAYKNGSNYYAHRVITLQRIERYEELRKLD